MVELARGDGRDVILQAFHWNLVKTAGTGTLAGRDASWYAILRDGIERIAELGFTLLYLPPPWRDDSSWQQGQRYGGGEGYFWHDFDLDSRYGRKAELRELCAAAHDAGLRVLVDLVPNHRDATRMAADRWDYPGPCWRRGGHDTGAGFHDGAFDLALDHPSVHGRIRRALEELMQACGVDGWRWDFVWGYGVEEVVSWIRGTAGREYFSMGEYWQGDADRGDDPLVERYGRDERERILGWARDTGGCAFDVRLKAEIQTGNPAWLKHGLAASAAPADRALLVTYVDNHDTGASPPCRLGGWGQQHWPCPPGFKSSAYAFVLSMPGTPSVYWPDCFDWGLAEPIGALIAARRRAGVVASSEWVDLTDGHGGFAGRVKSVTGEEALAVSIGSDYTGPGVGWRVVWEQPGEWTVWEREQR